MLLFIRNIFPVILTLKRNMKNAILKVPYTLPPPCSPTYPLPLIGPVNPTFNDGSLNALSSPLAHHPPKVVEKKSY